MKRIKDRPMNAYLRNLQVKQQKRLKSVGYQNKIMYDYIPDTWHRTSMLVYSIRSGRGINPLTIKPEQRI